MAFFKSFRNELNANTLVSNLEFARDRYPIDRSIGQKHLAAALKAFVAIKSGKAEKTLTCEGWKYIVHVSLELSMMLPTEEEKDAQRDLKFIIEQATIWRDEAYEQESDLN